MTSVWSISITLGILCAVFAQQPSGTQVYVDYPGLSDSCKQGLATNVSCSPFLVAVSQSDAILDSDGVAELCLDGCYASLQSARKSIQGACTNSDTIVHEDVAYPATFIVDHYMLAYQLLCRKDNATGQFCDPGLKVLMSQGGLNSTQLCSDCWLGGLALKLSSPLGYDIDIEGSFNSLTSSCNATKYSFTSPAAYALNATETSVPATVTATPAPSCTGSYTVQATDDCNSAARYLNVSTYSLLSANNLDLYCVNFAAAVGTNLCIPPKCSTYTWQALDTCDDVVAGLEGITLTQFLAWNPNFNSLCLNSINFVGYEVCISPPGGYLNGTSNDNGTATITAITTPVPTPTNAVTGSNTRCERWYTVMKGDTCATVSLANGISLTDFYFLNPEVNSNCTNLMLDEAYCVAPVGTITTYPGYTVTGVWPSITIPPASFPSVNTTIATKTGDPGYIYTPSYLPTASGTNQNCKYYENYNNNDTDLNNCTDIASFYWLKMADLLSWNPSLSSNESNCALQPGFSYCVGNGSSTLPKDEDSGSYCLPIKATEPETVSNCNCFTWVHGTDSADYTCEWLAEDCKVTLSQLTMWNPWLSGDCDTALYANLTGNDMRAVCIGVNDTSPTTTIETSATSAASTTSATSSAAPTQTGAIAGCQKFYTVQSGDSCSSLETKFSITFAQLYQWNPSIGDNCQNLWLGYAYCVEGPAPSNTASKWRTVSKQYHIESIQNRARKSF